MIEADNPAILLVEDDVNDVFFLNYAFDKAMISNPVVPVGTGQQAIDYLIGKNEYGNRARFPLPSLILLDLNLPKSHGIEVLRWKASRPDLDSIKVVILTSSRNQRDIEEC